MEYHHFPGDVMDQKYGPGAKAGNPFIDDVNRELREEDIERYEPLRKILEVCLIDTLEKIL